LGPRTPTPILFCVIQRCCPGSCHPDCRSIQRSVDEIVIWPASKPVCTATRSTTSAGTRPAAQHGARTAKDRRRLGGHSDADPARAWPARQAGFNPYKPRVKKMSLAQTLMGFRLSTGATKAWTRKCRLWCILAGGVTFARISQSSDGICTARKWPSRLRTT
jgi:hypothetical protein